MKRKLYIILPIIIVTMLLTYYYNSESEAEEQGTEFYVGTYTNSTSQGIYKYSLLPTGDLKSLGLVAETTNPSFLVKSPSKKYLLAVNENDEGSITSFEIQQDHLKFINMQSTAGQHPCFVSMTDQDHVLVANYSSGNIALLQLEQNGQFSDILDTLQHKGEGIHERQKSAHAHSVYSSPYSNDVLSVDLGTNEVIFSSLDSSSKKIIPSKQKNIKMENGAGPRHLAFHPKQNWIYVINELNSTISLIKNTSNSYQLQSSISTLPKGYSEENYCADIHISNDGQFLYASNRGHNSIACFSIDSDGNLELFQHQSTKGAWPRNFSLSPNNNHLLVANQHTDNIVSFKRDAKTGKLEYNSEINAPVPVCILF